MSARPWRRAKLRDLDLTRVIAGPVAGRTLALLGAAEWLSERDSPLGRLRYALPPVAFDGGPRDWARPPGRWGTDAPRWSQGLGSSAAGRCCRLRRRAPCGRVLSRRTG
ncbi:hypothetical protein ACFZB6_08220 [Streptomyces syringium]|uniref:hypothetical protein n=1 Tax=Streptomyces syringium TaxID=76729 RepID=UPI003409CCAF